LAAAIFRVKLTASMLPPLFPTKDSDPILHPYRCGLVFGFFNAFTCQVNALKKPKTNPHR